MSDDQPQQGHPSTLDNNNNNSNVNPNNHSQVISLSIQNILSNLRNAHKAHPSDRDFYNLPLSTQKDLEMEAMTYESSVLRSSRENEYMNCKFHKLYFFHLRIRIYL